LGSFLKLIHDNSILFALDLLLNAMQLGIQFLMIIRVKLTHFMSFCDETIQHFPLSSCLFTAVNYIANKISQWHI